MPKTMSATYPQAVLCYKMGGFRIKVFRCQRDDDLADIYMSKTLQIVILVQKPSVWRELLFRIFKRRINNVAFSQIFFFFFSFFLFFIVNIAFILLEVIAQTSFS